MKKVFLSLAALLAASTTGVALAGDIAAGKAKTGMCGSCHGAAGISAIASYPNLAGQKEAYLAKQLRDFKSGTRKDPAMASMAKMLSDTDIANIAAYYASL